MTEYVCGFLFTKAGRVALIRKARPAWQRGRINGIGGHIEPGETPLTAMAREFFEETGYSEEGWLPRVVLSGNDWRVHFFCAAAPSEVPLKSIPDEPCGWHGIDDLPPAVLPNLRWLIPLCLDSDVAGPVEVRDVSDPATNGAAVTQGK